MKRWRQLLLTAMLGCAASVLPAWAQEDESARIPSAVLDEQEPPAAATAGRSRALWMELDGEQVSRRALLVPIASLDRRREVQRLLVDARADWALADQLTAKLSAHLELSQTQDDGRQGAQQFNLREASLQWRVTERDVAELGRVNLRQGVAQGFNPSDYFRTRTALDTSTRDPQVQRINRLGTVMLNMQRVAEAGSLLIAYAPKLAQPLGLLEQGPQWRLRLGDTNGEDRLLVKGQLPLSATLRPELLAFKDRQGWRFGANLTQGFGQQVTAYLEYSGGRRKPVMHRALEQGVAVGELPDSVLNLLPAARASFQNELAVGATWTGAKHLSLSAEFDYQQGGLAAGDWARWFGLGGSGAEGAQLAWYLRQGANAQFDPLFRRQLFLRAQWEQAGHRDLSLSAFVNYALDDGSQLGQIALEYRLSQSARWRAMLLLTGGRANSQYGSDPARSAILIGYLHYI